MLSILTGVTTLTMRQFKDSYDFQRSSVFESLAVDIYLNCTNDDSDVISASRSRGEAKMDTHRLYTRGIPDSADIDMPSVRQVFLRIRQLRVYDVSDIRPESDEIHR